MADRRRLADALEADGLPDRKAVEEFVFNKPKAAPEPPTTPPAGRLPLTSRLRTDIGTALKRASLDRELAGTRPHQVQEILDEALEPWLRDRGYLP